MSVDYPNLHKNAIHPCIPLPKDVHNFSDDFHTPVSPPRTFFGHTSRSSDEPKHEKSFQKADKETADDEREIILDGCLINYYRNH